MGKRKQPQKKKIANYKPLVSVCTPTFNRRPFIPTLIKMFLNQDYPLDRMEWIIIDDGTDKIEDIILEANIPQIKYFKYDQRMVLGKKRNLMHEKCTGNIIVYMDDDDFYPHNRVSHAVETLRQNPHALCAGSSIIHVYFKHIDTVVEFGPYGPNHATAGTFAFKRDLLNRTKYNDTKALAEEKDFLKNYTIPFVQLDPFKTILVFSHNHNTFDKKTLLVNPWSKVMKQTIYKPEFFVPDDGIRNFFVNEIEDKLENYEPGRPENKPEVLTQIQEIKREREKKQEEATNTPTNIMVKDSQGNTRPLTSKEIVQIIQEKTQEVENFKNLLQVKENAIKENDTEKNTLKDEMVLIKKENELLKQKIALLENQ